jgi:hypothetical protein
MGCVMTKSKHIHKYKRDTLGKSYLIFKCMVAGCAHYISHQLAEGKLCECWRCGNPMVLAKPHCEKCVEHKSVELDIPEDISFADILNKE